MNTFRSGDKVYTVADIERLEQQLANANERVKELEKELDIAIECIEDSGIDYEEATEQLRKEQE